MYICIFSISRWQRIDGESVWDVAATCSVAIGDRNVTSGQIVACADRHGEGFKFGPVRKGRGERESLKWTVRCCTRPAPPLLPSWSLLLAHIKPHNNRAVDGLRRSDAAGWLARHLRQGGPDVKRVTSPYQTPGGLYFTPSPKSSSSVS